MKVEVITALFDIGREKYGDGRTMDEYLIWFKKTLSLNVTMTIFTEERFKTFVEENRNPENTRIIIQNLQDVPFYSWKDKISEIINSDFFKNKMKDTKRIECINPLYNIIQYSKFGWIKSSIDDNIFNSDYFMWMDAGCSRFFGDVDIMKTWPNVNSLDFNKFLIQGNENTIKMFPTLKIEDYIWDNNCTLVGTLFGGNKKIMLDVNEKILNIFKNKMVEKNCVNNEQFALTLLYFEVPEIFDLKIKLYSGHLPLFKLIS
jgi:hypothetical protein